MNPRCWADQVKPTADKLRLGGKMGLAMELDAGFALAIGDLIMHLAAALDAAGAETGAAEAQALAAIRYAAQQQVQHAERQLALKRQQLKRDVTWLVAQLGFIVMVAWWFS